MICYGCVHCDCDLTGDEDGHWICADCDDFADGNPSDPTGVTEQVSEHRVDVFVEDALDGSGRGWGWQCFTPGCGKEETGWATYAEAEAAAEIHREGSDG